jgi:nucleoside-diphosphate-sugar epimerase
MTRTAVLTGITGFIGGTLAARLIADGWQVHAIVRPESDTSDLPPAAKLVLHRHDGTVAGLASILQEARPDIVFHLASLYLAEHKPEQIEALVQSNLTFPTQLLEAMALTGAIRLVNAGTSWQHYGTDAYRPVNLYAATKQAFEDLLAYYHDARGISAMTLKLFDTLGAGDKRRKLVGILCDAARSGETLAMSPGDQLLDLLHVDDVASAFLRAADLLAADERPMLRSFLISGERLTAKQLVALVEKVAGKPLPVTFGGRPYREREVMVPVAAGPDDRLPGWAPRLTLEQSLADLLAG